MKLEKKHWQMLIAGVVILFLVYWFFFRKKKSESSYDPALPIFGNESGYAFTRSPINISGASIVNRAAPVSGTTTVGIGCASGSLMVGPTYDSAGNKVYNCVPIANRVAGTTGTIGGGFNTGGGAIVNRMAPASGTTRASLGCASGSLMVGPTGTDGMGNKTYECVPKSTSTN